MKIIVAKIVVFTREEFCDNDGVELAVESLNEGHNLRTPGTEKFSYIWGCYHQRWQKHCTISFLTLLKNYFEAYCSIYA